MILMKEEKNKNIENKRRIIVAMSGGVDSSVAALLLMKEGYDPIGVFMRLHESDGKAEAAARAVCNKLNIRFYPVNISPDFKEKVFNHFISSYGRGLTPNPCVECNRLIKFGKLLELAKNFKCNLLATGHYARLRRKLKITKLYKPEDNLKDQTYFLYNLEQNKLKHILFPLGDFRKEDVRKIADRNKLPYLKKESQDVCFLNQDGKIIDHNVILKKHLKLKPGDIVTLEGKIIGRHQGLPLYTTGQRRGVEIGGTGPYYVVRADFKTNILYVSKNGNDPALFKNSLIAKQVNWLSGVEPKFPFACEAVIRYRHKPVRCELIRTGKNIKVNLNEPQRAITPGQSVVFYKKDELLGGGVIK